MIGGSKKKEAERARLARFEMSPGGRYVPIPPLAAPARGLVDYDNCSSAGGH